MAKKDKEISEAEQAEVEEKAQESSEEKVAPEKQQDDKKEAPGEKETGEEKISEEEIRRRLEEQLEKITVLDVAMEMMVTLSSIAYQKFGLPKEVNAKYRDLDQARLAIDCLSALLDICEPTASTEQSKPLKGTLANLKLLYTKEAG